MPDYDNIKKWWDFINSHFSNISFLIPWFIIVFLLYLIIKYPENLQILASWVQRLFANFSSKISKNQLRMNYKEELLRLQSQFIRN